MPALFFQISLGYSKDSLCAFSTFANWRNRARVEPLSAFLATFTFPSRDFGPVDFSHGRQILISSA